MIFFSRRAAKLASDTYNVEVMRIFAETLGVIVNGEITQLFSNNFLTDRDIYFSRIYAKTASLFETACKAAALLAIIRWKYKMRWAYLDTTLVSHSKLLTIFSISMVNKVTLGKTDW